MGFVYLLLEVNQHGEESYKIGITKNDPRKRNKALQTGNSNKITVLNAYESTNYKLVERWLHGRFKTKKTLAGNEWFNLTPQDVLGFLDECKKGDDIITFMKKENPLF